MASERSRLAKLSTNVIESVIPNVPPSVLSRDGVVVSTVGGSWTLPVTGRSSGTIDFDSVPNPVIRKIFQNYLVERMRSVSSATVLTDYYAIWVWLVRIPAKLSPSALSKAMVELCKNAIKDLRKSNKLARIYQLTRFYVWGVIEFPETCFIDDFGYHLQEMRIPGDPKFQAVLTEDERAGPLHRVLELPQLVKELALDKGGRLEHYQQRAAVALCIAYGPNPRIATYINEDDLVDLTPDGPVRTYELSLPRIKKGFLHPREDLRKVSVSAQTAHHLLALIDANQKFGNKWSSGGMIYNLERRLFRSSLCNVVAQSTKLWADIFNFTTPQFTALLADFAARRNIISLVTKEPLHLTSRRLRYTFATGLVLQGASPRAVAAALDHSDTQNIRAYFALKDMIVQQLDEAASGKYAHLTSFFNGNIIATDATRWDSIYPDKIDLVSEGVVHELGACGSNTLCGLNPPISCYLCPMFKAYSFANHRAVLDVLTRDQNLHRERYRTAGFQFDELIRVVNEVIYKCEALDAS